MYKGGHMSKTDNLKNVVEPNHVFFPNKKPRFWDMPHFARSAVAPPENVKPFFPEIRNPVLGTCRGPIRHHLVLFGFMVSFQQLSFLIFSYHICSREIATKSVEKFT